MNRQQKNRKDRRRFSRLMSLALSASMVLSSSVFAYGSPVDPNVAGLIAEQVAEEAIGEQQAGVYEGSIKGFKAEYTDTNKLYYTMSVGDLEAAISSNLKVTGKPDDNTNTPVKDLTTDEYEIDKNSTKDTDLFKKLKDLKAGEYLNAGDYTVDIKGKDTFAECQTDYVTVKINPLQVDSVSMTVENPTGGYTYTGNAHTPKVTSISINGKINDKIVSINASTADDIAKYIAGTATYENNINAASSDNLLAAPSVSISLNGNFTGTTTATGKFTIDPASISGAQINYISSNYAYNGQPQGPVAKDVTVILNNKTLTPETDYILEYYKDGTKIDDRSAVSGNYQVAVKGVGNYTNEIAKGTGEAEKLNYTITNNTAFNSQNIDIKIKNQGYTGKEINIGKSSIDVKDLITGATLVYDQDYEIVKYLESDGETVISGGPTNPGYYYAVVQGKGGYKNDQMNIMFRVVQADISSAEVVFSNNNSIYNGKEQRPNALKVYFKSSNNKEVELTKDVDYTYDIADMTFVDAGYYDITIHGMNTYEGTEVVAQYYIAPKAIDSSSIEVKANNAPSPADNGAKRLSIRVRDINTNAATGENKIKDLVEGKDYEIVSKNSTYVEIRGIWNYNASKRVNIGTDTTMDLADSKITAKLTAGSLPYAGREIKPAAGDFTVTEEGTSGTRTLVAGTDYRISTYYNNVEAGTATAVLEGIGKYSNFKNVEFTITGIDLSTNYTIKEDGLLKEVDYSPIANKNYANEIAANLDRRIVAKEDSSVSKKTLFRNTDYEVSFLLNGEKVREVKDAGEYTVVVTGKGAYSGELTTTFTIKGTPIDTVVDASLSQTSFEYAGQPIEPEVTVTTKVAMDALVKDTDYEIVYADNNRPGTAYAIVKGMGRYSGVISLEFEITGDPSITPPGDEKQVQDITTKYGNTLKRQLGLSMTQTVKGAKTDVTFTSSNPKVATIDKNGKITCKAVGTTVITTTAIESDEYQAVTKTLTLTVMPKKVGVKSLKSTKKRQVVVKSATTTAGNNGYQIQYVNNGVTKRVGVTTSKKSVTRTLKNLTSGKNVKVRIRAYKKVDGKTIFGPYCNWKTVKVK